MVAPVLLGGRGGQVDSVLQRLTPEVLQPLLVVGRP